MLFQTACILLQIAQPSLLVTPSGLHARPAPSNAAMIAALDTSSDTLRARAHDLAHSVGCSFTLDLFATDGNSITPRFYSSTHNGLKPRPRRWTR